MNTESERIPFHFLSGLLRVLIIDTDADAARTRARSFPSLFYTEVVSSLRRADELLCCSTRFHVCIHDVPALGPDAARWFFLCKYGLLLPCIVFSSGGSARDGFDAYRYGASDLIAQSEKNALIHLVKSVSLWSLKGVINPLYCQRTNDVLDKATDALFCGSPNQVTQWALDLGLSDREIRYTWRTKVGANAKIILFMYQLFSQAFKYYSDPHNYDVRSDVYRHCEEYYHMHRSVINDYIAFGHVVRMNPTPF